MTENEAGTLGLVMQHSSYPPEARHRVAHDGRSETIALAVGALYAVERIEVSIALAGANGRTGINHFDRGSPIRQIQESFGLTVRPATGGEMAGKGLVRLGWM